MVNRKRFCASKSSSLASMRCLLWNPFLYQRLKGIVTPPKKIIVIIYSPSTFFCWT